MKTLLILRHGKAEDTNPGGDRQRNLTNRGRRDSERIGQEVLAREAVPSLIVSSDAARARQTAELCAAAIGYESEIVIEPAIYDDGADGVMKVIRRAPVEAASLMIVGHNPTLETLVSELIDPVGGEAGDVRLPTAGLACLDLDLESWSGLRIGMGKLRWLVTPKLLEG